MGPGEPGFHEHYHAARAGQKPIVERAEQSKKGTLDELCKKHLEWLERQVAAGTMSSKTHQSRRTGLKQACETLDPDGDRMGSLNCDLPEEAFVHIQDAFGIRTAAADTCIKALRAAYRWGAKRGFPKNSPVFEVERVHLEGGGAKPWRAQDVEKFLATHGPGTMARLWFCLAYDSHGRIGDMHLLGSKNLVQYDGERYLEWQPAKRGSAFVSIPLGEMLATELELHEDRDVFLATQHGKPFASPGALGNRVREWIIEAGLCVEAKDADGNLIYELKGKQKTVKRRATRSQHGIRKGIAELMAERGATEYELMAAFGWNEAKTASVYTKKFHRRGAATAASKRIAEMKSGPREPDCGPHSELKVNKIEKFEDKWQPVGESNPSFQVENLAS